MKRQAPLFGALLIGALSASAPVQAASPAGPFGIGVGGGLGVSGLSGKYYMGSTALQGMVGTYAGDGLGVGVDYLLEMPNLTSSEPVDIAWNIGAGGSVGTISDTSFVAVSGVAGLEFNFNPVPIDLVLEYRPGVALVPGFAMDLVNFSGHLRFYFP